MDRVQSIVVGAGVVGLAVARRLAQAGQDVIVLEASGDIGSGISSRNSEVIHAGIYYPAGSLMAQLCIKGKHALYEFCDDHGVPYRRCGKLIVATSAPDEAKLADIKSRAEINGVDDLQFLDAKAAGALEPALSCTAALLSPSTGILDAHAFMLALRGDAEDAGAAFAFHAPMQRATITNDGFIVEAGGHEPMTLQCAQLINAAGLQAVAVAHAIDGLPTDQIPTAYYAKGNYFRCTTRAPFSRLIYPVPEPGGLGVHLTLDLGGDARFGPDLEWIEQPNYDVDAARAERFYPAIRRYWPALQDGALQPAYAGVRPKIVPPEIAVQDFTIQDATRHGAPGLINLFGIESPGLTSALAIADEVAQRLG